MRDTEERLKVTVYISTDTPTPGPGSVVSKINCDFESADICKYVQDTTDRFNWTRKTLTTTSRFTGPSNDHTYGTASGTFNKAHLVV